MASAIGKNKLKASFLTLLCLVALPAYASETLRLVTQDFPPFSYQLSDQAGGLGVDLVQRICDEMAQPCTIEVQPWRRAQQAVRRGNFDGMFLIGRTPERDRWLRFSPPLLETEYGLFVRESDSLTFREPRDIAGYRVAVYGPSSTSRSLERLSRLVAIEVSLYPDANPGFMQLPVGRVDAVYSNRLVGEALIARHGLRGIRYAGSHRRLSYFVGFSRTNVSEETVAAFGEAWRRLMSRGALDDLLDNYGVTASGEFYTAR